MTHIKSKNGLFDLNFKELYHYRDLIYLFFKRNYSTRYKQTILGPLWLIFAPLITVTLYAVVFGNLAGLSTGGIPYFVFYLSSNALWVFFSTSLIQTSSTFTMNAAIMGKVYFPRLVMPISSVVTGFLDLFIQLAMLVVIMLFYYFNGIHFNIDIRILLVPLLIIQTGLLSLGFGIIIAALTTKYRDLTVLFTFGVQLWMYATPVVYTSEIIPAKYLKYYMLNPMSPIMECWRNVITGSGTFYSAFWGYSWITTFIVLFAGILLFNKVEKTFMDTV